MKFFKRIWRTGLWSWGIKYKIIIQHNRNNITKLYSIHNKPLFLSRCTRGQIKYSFSLKKLEVHWRCSEWKIKLDPCRRIFRCRRRVGNLRIFSEQKKTMEKTVTDEQFLSDFSCWTSPPPETQSCLLINLLYLFGGSYVWKGNYCMGIIFSYKCLRYPLSA